jgi:membrane-associated protease RseP (regulator of RpoE activity)
MIWNEAGAGGLLGLLAALTVVTIWHELGHLWVARRYGVPVKLIGVGIGPAIWRFCLGGDVTFEVRALPVGMVIGVIARRAGRRCVRWRTTWRWQPGGHWQASF